MTKSTMAGVASLIALVCVAQLGACSDEQPPAPPAQSSSAPAAQPPAPQPAAPPPAAPAAQQPAVAPAAEKPAATYSAESLESLLAPIALYPDPVLAQVLATSTNPQEVLDAGNWLIKNPDLSGDALESAAITAGFTPPMVALVQFPTVVDMMCMQMDWTTDLGSAFLADQKGVLDAVQRLRKQAHELGNLETSKQMKVTTESVNNQDVIVVQPAQPEVVYVPQYSPTTVYTQPAPAPAATTTTQVVNTDNDDGYSGGEMITTGLLAFGAGILVNEVFDDDDNDNYYPNWGGGYPPPYYPPPYQPRYGNGYRPAHGYQRPANYQRGFNNNNVFINADGDDYFNRFDRGSNNYRKNPDSPISKARQDRPELAQLNNRNQELARPNRPAEGAYAGRNPQVREKAGLDKRPAATGRVPTGTYAGAKPGTRPQVSGTRDRGRQEAGNTARPSAGGKIAGAAQRPQAATNQSRRPSGFQGSQGSGRQERAASKRGRESMSQRPRPSASGSSGRSGGGGGGKSGRSGGRAGGR